MLQSSKVGAIVFFVRELGRSVAFYRDVLGLGVDAMDGHDGPFATAQLGEVSLVFLQREVRAGESPVVVFEVEGGIDDHADALVAHDVDIVTPVSAAPDGGLTLDFVDPDRNLLSLYQQPGKPRRK